MAAPIKFHVFAGAETGLLKGIDVHKSKWENVTSVDQVHRSQEICTMCFENQNEKSILLGTRGGMVKTYDIATQEMKEILQATEDDEHILKGLYKWDEKYVTCTNVGRIQVWQENEAEQLNIDCGTGITCMKPEISNQSRLGTGGKDNDLKIWDLCRADAGPVFKAKNVRNDFLDLQVPVWNTDMDFIPDSTNSEIITSTAHHQVRLYDPNRSQRRPVVNIEWGDCPITSICVCKTNTRQCIVGNARGEQALMDLRKQRMIHQYKGGAGSIRNVQCHPSKAVVVSCGLDRYVRIHDIESKILTHKIYLKSRLNRLLLTSNWDDDTDIKAEVKQELVDIADDDEQEDDEVWDVLDTAAHPPPSKRKANPEKLNSTKKRRSKRVATRTSKGA